MLCSQLFFVVFVYCFVEIQSECRQSFMTLCDDLMDIHNETTEGWSELIIGLGTSKAEDDLYSIDYDAFPLDRFEKLTTLIILGQINDIKSNTFYIDSEDISLENFKFYGNNIRKLRHNTFDSLELRTLSFVKNNLDFIHKDTFYNCRIDTIDFSENNLETIESNIFTEETLNNATKELVLRRNKITTIESNSFPDSLEILNLDYNKVSVLAFDVFSNLKGLLELTLSNNRFSQIPDFRPLNQLQILDLSHNELTVISTVYLQCLSQLEVLDLSYNKMYQTNLLNHLTFRTKGVPTQISLAFNRFTQMQLVNETLANHTIILYGNPWSCKCWEKIEKFIVDNNFKRHKCDLEFFGTGQTPYCLYFDDPKIDCDLKYLNKPYLTDKDYDMFMKVIENNKKNVVCNLSPRRQ